MSDSSFRKRTLAPLIENIRKGFQYFCIVAYFWPWSYKTRIRHWLKVSSLWTLLVSTGLLFAEVSLKWIGGERLQKWISPEHITEVQSGLEYLAPVKVYFLPSLFVLSVGYLFWYHYRESKKPEHEFEFLTQLNRFMRERETYGSEETLIPAALRLFYKVFHGSRIERCSLFTLSDSGLAIPEEYVHPNCTDPSYRIALRITEGVAGLVCSDALPRYVPRLSYPFAKRRKLLPAIPFPHAVKFESRVNGEKLELVNEDLDAYAFKRSNTEPLFLSFVSVPLKPVGSTKCFGVLNFDFSRVDALDKSDIAMASVLGLLLADEVNRMRSRTKSEHLSAKQDHTDSRLPVKNELRGPTRPLIVSLGETATPREHESLTVLDTPPFEISGQDSSTSEQGVSSYLTWSRIKAGWAPFKRKRANSE